MAANSKSNAVSQTVKAYGNFHAVWEMGLKENHAGDKYFHIYGTDNYCTHVHIDFTHEDCISHKIK